MMETLLRAVGVTVIALVLLVALRGISGTFAMLVKVGAVLLLFGIVVLRLSEGVAEIRALTSEFIDEGSFVGVSISVMVRALGIALIGRICADICRECGEGGLANGVESVAGVMIFSLSLPILSEILRFAVELLRKGS